jgi:hypothetical protein
VLLARINMSAEIIQFVPRSNPNAVRPLIAPHPDPLELMAFEIINQVMPDTSPSELNPDQKEPA